MVKIRASGSDWNVFFHYIPIFLNHNSIHVKKVLHLRNFVSIYLLSWSIVKQLFVFNNFSPKYWKFLNDMLIFPKNHIFLITVPN